METKIHEIRPVFRLMSRERTYIVIVAALVVLGWLTVIASGARILVSEKLIKPGQSYIVEGYGDLGASREESLVCSYFTGRKMVARVYSYAPNNLFGKDECPFLAKD